MLFSTPDKWKGKVPKAQLLLSKVPVLVKKMQISVGSSSGLGSQTLPSCHHWGSQVANPTDYQALSATSKCGDGES